MLENVSFQLFFHGVGELHACVGEEFYAVVVVGIVRGGNDHAGLKIILADEAGNARGGDYAGESYRTAALCEASSEESGDVRAGFASVHADEDVSGRVLAKKICGERTASGKKSGVVERRCAGNAANAIGSEKFFGHERGAASSRAADRDKV